MTTGKFIQQITFGVAVLGVSIPQSAHSSVYIDAFQQCAKKEITKKHPKWIINAYKKGLKNKPKLHKIAQTIFYPHEGFPRGSCTRWGSDLGIGGCSESTAASNHLSKGTCIWVIIKEGDGQILGQMRRIEDTGASWNDSKWRGYCWDHYKVRVEFWVDIWVENVGDFGLTNDITPRNCLVIK
jgi:hypothetical protein